MMIPGRHLGTGRERLLLLDFYLYFLVHPTSAYPLEKKAFHPLDEIRADTKVRPYKDSLTLALSRGERGSGD